jgi:uncharacterized repeat protein (TIGR03803 family)
VLALSGNTLYGTAAFGGSAGYGTVFKLDTGGTAFTTLYNFQNTDGANPINVIVSGNTLYGTTGTGGSLGQGTLFALDLNSKVLTSLYSFTGGSDGANPYAGLIVSGNTLYGTAASGGGSFYDGTVFGFLLAPVTSVLELTFQNYSNGQFSLLLSGADSTNYIIQVSTNLAINNWIPVFTNTATGGTFNFTDAHATNPIRFYRAMQQ